MKTRWLVLVIVVLVVIVGGGVLGFMYLQHQANPSPKPAESTSDSTPVACQPANFMLTLGSGSGAAGSTYYDLGFMNMGNKLCSVSGYPKVTLVSKSGQTVGKPAAQEPVTTASTSPATPSSAASSPAAPAPVLVQPMQTVTSTLQVPQADNFQPDTCQSGAVDLQASLPGVSGTLSIATSIADWCPGFSIGPIHL